MSTSILISTVWSLRKSLVRSLCSGPQGISLHRERCRQSMFCNNQRDNVMNLSDLRFNENAFEYLSSIGFIDTLRILDEDVRELADIKVPVIEPNYPDLAALAWIVDRIKPINILEFGSGYSTVSAGRPLCSHRGSGEPPAGRPGRLSEYGFRSRFRDISLYVPAPQLGILNLY